jgi:uncharacterized protein YgbK (DUF1537 family)
MIKIGVIADDFTGATDIASFLVENGLPTVQINGVPTGKMPEAIDALVISLKTRSCPVVEATQQSLAALSWLQQQGCKQIYFKYCSTFDSTAKGNIGPVTQASLVGTTSHCEYGRRGKERNPEKVFPPPRVLFLPYSSSCGFR